MSRPLRLHVPGMLYHVVARGNDKACIFTDDGDCASFLEVLTEALGRFRTGCLAYCLLWNHYHLLLAAGDEPISRVMQQLNSTYCQRFNRRHGRVGHVLQGRFGSRIVEDGAYTRAVLRYIALNPVAAGRVHEPASWCWSFMDQTGSRGTCVPCSRSTSRCRSLCTYSDSRRGPRWERCSRARPIAPDRNERRTRRSSSMRTR